MSRISPILASACAYALVGCYGSSTVLGPQTAALHHAEQGEDDGVLVADDGSALRLDGDSELRFTRVDGTTTEWIVARDLEVNDDGVFEKHETDGVQTLDGLKWRDVRSIEVKNLDRGETMIAVVAISAAVVGLIFIASKSKGDIPVPNINVGHVDFNVNGGSSSGDGGDGAEPIVTENLGESSLEQPDATGARDLLDETARRRSIVRFVPTLEGGGETTASGLRLGTAVVALRIDEFLDFGLGARLISFVNAEGAHSYTLPIFRFGMHADLDAHRRFAAAFGVEAGAGGDVLDHVRVDWAFRVRLVDAFWLGIHPLTPVYDRFGNGAHGPAWSAPSTIDVSFAF